MRKYMRHKPGAMDVVYTIHYNCIGEQGYGDSNDQL